MDMESWFTGYETGVMLHAHIRPVGIRASAVATMSVTGIAADLEWYADLSGVSALTRLTAEYTGAVSARYSYDGKRYTDPVPLKELLQINPTGLFSGLKRNNILWFRFHLADDSADMTSFTIWGIRRETSEV